MWVVVQTCLDLDRPSTCKRPAGQLLRYTDQTQQQEPTRPTRIVKSPDRYGQMGKDQDQVGIPIKAAAPEFGSRLPDSSTAPVAAATAAEPPPRMTMKRIHHQNSDCRACPEKVAYFRNMYDGFAKRHRLKTYLNGQSPVGGFPPLFACETPDIPRRRPMLASYLDPCARKPVPPCESGPLRLL